MANVRTPLLALLVFGCVNSQAAGQTFRALGVLPGGDFYSYALAVSDDGRTVVGYSGGDLYLQGFRWTLAEGIQPLGHLPGGNDSIARGVSADGSVVVGESDGSGGRWAFRWTASEGMVGLGVPPGVTRSNAHGLSADGSFVVGSISGPSGTRAFRWSQATGMEDLGGWLAWSAVARGVSADGTRVVGYSGDMQALLWTPRAGFMDLNNYARSLGIDLTGWQLNSAYAISPDGNCIVGMGLHDGQSVAWLLQLSGPLCVADCNGDGQLSLSDFGCFTTKFALGDPYADCNGDSALNLSDFGCFQTKFALGCP